MGIEDNLNRWRGEIYRLDCLIEPLAKQGLDIFAADFAANILDPKSHSEPIDSIGIRDETTALLREIIQVYGTEDDQTRTKIRKLFKEAPSFRWAATLPIQQMTESYFSAWLMLFSIKDQEDDCRDAILELESQVSLAKGDGINVVPILESAARLSSTENLYGMGSTRHIIEEQIRVVRSQR